MVKLLALELLESLHIQLQKKADEGVHSAEVFEKNACNVLNNLHGCKDPFSIYKQELNSLTKHRKRSNNPLTHVIRRLTEELFAIVTTSRYPIFLTPHLYVIYISLLTELSLKELPSLFLETYDGNIESFQSDFASLLLEIYIRRSPLWTLIKNFRFSIENIKLGVTNILNDIQLKQEFQEFHDLLSLEPNELTLINFLPLFFTNSQSLKRGIMQGLANKIRLKSSISPKSRISSNDSIKILDNFALTRMSLAILIKIFDKFPLFNQNEIIKFEPNFFNLLKTFEFSLITFLAGSNIGNTCLKKEDSATTNLVYELDGTTSTDVFTIENKVLDYQPFHFLHIQVVSGLRIFLKGFNYINNSETNDEYFSLFYESVVIYLMRVFNQVVKVLEFQEFNSIQDHIYKNNYQKFNTYLEIIPSEMILLIQNLKKDFSKNFFKKIILEIYNLQISKKYITSLFLITFIEIVKESKEIDCDFFVKSWKHIFEDYLYNNLLDTYIIESFIYLISDLEIRKSLVYIDMSFFLNKYLGVLIRTIVYHPNLSAKPIIVFILDCIKILKNQNSNLLWFEDFIKIILNVICMPLMTFFPQKITCDKNELKTLINYMKPNDRILNYLSSLIYPDIVEKNLLKNDIKSIICDLSSNFLLSSIYNDNSNNKYHTKIIFQETLFLLEMIFNEIVDSIMFIKKEDENFYKVSNFISELLNMIPYIFHQGPVYSLELYEKFIKIIINILNYHAELLFDEKIFDSLLNCLKIEVYSNIMQTSTICWLIGETIMLQKKEVLNLNQEKILKLIDILNSTLEFCFSDCLEFFRSMNIDRNIFFLSKNENGDDNNSEFSISSDSSFVSDISFEIDKDTLLIDDKNEHNYEISLDNENADFMDDNIDYKRFQESNKYVDNIYLIETIISALCKIGMVCRQFKTEIIRILDGFEEKLVSESVEQRSTCQQDELIQSSRLIVIKKISTCLKKLNYSSLFLPTTKHSIFFESHNSRSLNSIYHYN